MEHIETEWKADSREQHFSYVGGHGGKMTCIRGGRGKLKRKRQIFLHMLVATLICVGLTGLVGEIMWRQGSVQRQQKSIWSKRKKNRLLYWFSLSTELRHWTMLQRLKTELIYNSVLSKSIFQTHKTSYRHILHTSLWAQGHFFSTSSTGQGRENCPFFLSSHCSVLNNNLKLCCI